MNSSAEAQTRSARGKSTEVIDLEPLAAAELKRKSVMISAKKKAKMSTPMGEKLIVDAIRIIRSSWRLTALRSNISRVRSSGIPKKEAKMTKGAIEVEKYGIPDGVYISYWNLSKVSRLIYVDEKRQWVKKMMPLGVRTKFEIFKETNLGRKIDHALYEVNVFTFVQFL